MNVDEFCQRYLSVHGIDECGNQSPIIDEFGDKGAHQNKVYN